MTTQFQSEDFDRSPALSQTAWALQELQLYGTRAFQDEVDLRPMPEPERLIDAVSDIFDALAATLGDTRMEPDLEELLWGQVNLFHRAAARTERLLDGNEVRRPDEKIQLAKVGTLANIERHEGKDNRNRQPVTGNR